MNRKSRPCLTTGANTRPWTFGHLLCLVPSEPTALLPLPHPALPTLSVSMLRLTAPVRRLASRKVGRGLRLMAWGSRDTGNTEGCMEAPTVGTEGAELDSSPVASSRHHGWH